MENPSVGQVVHYVDAYSNHRAAIIVEVVDQVLYPGCVRLTWYRIGNTTGWVHETLSAYSEGHQQYTWHWPERV